MQSRIADCAPDFARYLMQFKDAKIQTDIYTVSGKKRCHYIFASKVAKY